jgi:hypothetical protein
MFLTRLPFTSGQDRALQPGDSGATPSAPRRSTTGKRMAKRKKPFGLTSLVEIRMRLKPQFSPFLKGGTKGDLNHGRNVFDPPSLHVRSGPDSTPINPQCTVPIQNSPFPFILSSSTKIAHNSLFHGHSLCIFNCCNNLQTAIFPKIHVIGAIQYSPPSFMKQLRRAALIQHSLLLLIF